MHRIPNTQVNHIFSKGLAPVLDIDPGERVCFQTLDAANNQVRFWKTRDEGTPLHVVDGRQFGPGAYSHSHLVAAPTC